MKPRTCRAGETSRDAWTWAVRLLERWRTGDGRVDWLLESLPGDLGFAERARVQALFVGTVRHLGRIEQALDRLMKRAPRPVVAAGLRVAGFELIAGAGEGHRARVGHHAVERIKRLASPPEARFANAVVRRLAAALAESQAEPDPAAGEAWSTHWSHPPWLVNRWREQWGLPATRALLQWNQSPAPVIVRLRPGSAAAELPPWLEPVAGADAFFAAQPGHWSELAPLIESGRIHVQDAAARLALDLLDLRPGEAVLDLCAAPGGKSLAMADRLQAGTLVAMDMPGRRLPRLEESLRRVPDAVKATAIAGDLLRGGARALAARNLPTIYPAVLIDVPCSNTGVMRHRVDVKWRLQPDSFSRHARQQRDLLRAAAERVAPGGRLVYSTCSIDPEENEQVAQAFVRQSRGRFVREEELVSLPWQSGHDGAMAFRFRRT